MQTTSRPLYFALKDTLNRERRFPASLFFALRGAFRHRNLYLFRVNDSKGQDFVMLKAAVVLDPTHAVKELRDVLTYVQEHAACTKAELVAGLAGTDEAKMKETLVQLAWLVEKGHVIEYYNDVLSAPLEFPAFRFLQGEKQAGAPQQHGGPRRAPDSVVPPTAQPATANEASAPVEAAAQVSAEEAAPAMEPEAEKPVEAPVAMPEPEAPAASN